MPVNQAELEFFARLAKEAEANPPKPLDDMTLEEYREVSANFIQFAGPVADVAITDITIEARDGHAIPVRLFDPGAEANGPLLVMYPGCGYIIDLFEANAVSASRVAKLSKVKVALVDFRIAPEHPLPTAIYDGYDATKYLAQHADEFGIDPNKIIIGGISSGAHCAAVISNLARNDADFPIAHQILMNGTYDLTRSQHEFDSYQEHDFLLTQDAINYIFKILNVKPEDYKNPIISPIFEEDLTGLPSTTMMIGEYDGLRSDSEAYYQRLMQAGNEVEYMLLVGETHNTYILMGELSDAADPAVRVADIVCRWL